MNIADKGARFGNFIIDSIIYLIIISIVYTLLLSLWSLDVSLKTAFTKIFNLTMYFSYYLFFEYFLGRTPGKFLTNTLIVDRNGDKPTFKSLFTRNLLRLVPFDIISFIFVHEGLHDSFSKTRVIFNEKVTVWSHEKIEELGDKLTGV